MSFLFNYRHFYFFVSFNDTFYFILSLFMTLVLSLTPHLSANHISLEHTS